MEINLKEYFMLIKKRWWLIVLVVSVCTLLTTLYSRSNYVPIYQASTKLIVNKTSEQGQLGKEQIDFGAIGVNMSLINTYKEIIKTPAIMDKVVQRNPDLHVTTDQLISIVNVTNLNETQVMSVVVRHLSHERAVRIANAVSDVIQTEIPNIMKVDNITILNRAKVQDNPTPVNQKSNQYIILSFVGSLAATIGIILLLDALDDTLKTDEDIREIFELAPLAYVPKMKSSLLYAKRKRKVKNREEELAYAKTIY
ncbi:YveK family protein [Paenibacillus roseipurpureus]|uniref:Wzz/FepE/Etk N-terminal domain-containing protein n=1 Tax=Paenibacillus roseopurpureus TaxID=2918901 RepID=A0AA96RJI4_9BACL|nr:Wzz/FepE/Etk N-terminal domain-containing protein [Paenibacillus sp. MBLB1832]WNR43820.1 Wzz/FepE/Etk N-terminal domain-containing protein [Paenibacillus sp. MBLB1832]